jgi:outer membrane lipoprotein-sorting protein
MRKLFGHLDRACAVFAASRLAVLGLATLAATVAGAAVLSAEDTHPLVPVLKIARASQEAMRQVKDYEATFTKQELIGKKMESQSMQIKLRETPFSVYLRFYGSHEGREVIYQDGKNNGKLLAHETGFKKLVGTVAISPTDDDVMEENHYPITMIGMANMLNTTIQQWESELSNPNVSVKYFPNAKLGDMDCQVIQTWHTQKTGNSKFHMTRLYFDKNTKLPVRSEQFGWPTKKDATPPLIEEYTYSNIRTNVGLTDADFDTKNPKYQF